MHLNHGFSLKNGKYEIIDLLGQGGFGIIYKASGKASLKGALGSLETTMQVAIKEFFFKDYCERDSDTMRVTFSSTTGKELFQRFKEKLVKEAIILSKLNHPNIIRVIEIFEENNTAYMVMEFVEGNSMLDILNEQGTIPISQAIDYTSQIGVALSYVHAQNILHLDVKPSNILIRKKDDRALLIDFGVSKRYSPEHKETSFTPVGRSKGYAPPEQYIDKGTALFAPSLDVYSLGATLYHCITGVIPPEPYEILEYGLALTSELNTTLSGNFEQAILKAMALKKADRFQTVEEFIHAIKDAGKSKQEPEPIKLTLATTPESVYSGETLPGDKALKDKLPEPAASLESPNIKSSEVLYAGDTQLDIEKPVSSGSGKEPETTPEKPPQGYSGETEHDNEPPVSSPPEPPATPGEPSKKPDPGHSWLGWIIAGAVIVGFALTLVWCNRGPSVKEIEEKRIADSILVADSLAMVQAEQQRIADSIAIVQYEKMISDSIDFANSQTQKTNQTDKTTVTENEIETIKKTASVPEIEMTLSMATREKQKGNYSEAITLYQSVLKNKSILDDEKKQINLDIRECNMLIDLEKANNALKASDYQTALQYYMQVEASPVFDRIYKGYVQSKIDICNKKIKKPTDISMDYPDVKMVYVKGGTFQMGQPKKNIGGNGLSSDEQPVHSVTVNNYYIGKYEVTQEQWRKVMGSNPSSFSGCETCPVESVSWDDVQVFIRKLNQKTGKNYRLPTEAEWEYAARGGNQTMGYTYSGSNNLDDVAWYKENSYSQTHPTGKKEPNELGIYDMSGNVWEWCADWYTGDYYAKSSATNPKNTVKESRRVDRGGSWRYYQSFCRVTNRGNWKPNEAISDLGFRLLREE